MAKEFKHLKDPELIKLLKAGAVGVLPTDTVYGLVCIAKNPESVDRLYALKKRIAKLGTVIAANQEQLVELGIKPRYLKAVEEFWPGAVSVVIPISDPAMQYLHQGILSIPVRIPADAKLLQLLKQTGVLLTTSANLADQPVSETIKEAKDYFGDKVDFYVDGDKLNNQSSTIIRIIDDAIEIIREGAVKIDEAGRIIK